MPSLIALSNDFLLKRIRNRKQTIKIVIKHVNPSEILCRHH